MALKLKYTDEHGILHINMSPSASPRVERTRPPAPADADITDPKFDTINNRFGQYDLFGGTYDADVGRGAGGETRSLFRSRYNSVEEELANTPYAFATERSLRLGAANDPLLDISIDSRASDDASPSKDLLDDRFFNTDLNLEYENGLFGPEIDFTTKSYLKNSDEEETPAFTVTQLIHAQDRYFDLSSRHSSSVVTDSPRAGLKSVPKSTGKVKSLRNNFEVRSAPGSAKKERTVKIVERFGSVKSQAQREGAFKVLSSDTVKAAQRVEPPSATIPLVPISKRKGESSFAILTETPKSSRPTSPRSLPPDLKNTRVSPFRGRGFREETSRHTTPRTSAANSRASSPFRRRTNSLSKIDKMAQAVTLPPPILNLSRPHSPRNFVKENIEDVREISELNREKHELEEEKMRREQEESLLKEMGLLEKNAKTDGNKSVVASRGTSRSNSPSKINMRSRSNSPSAILHFENIAQNSKDFINTNDGLPKPTTHRSRVRTVSRSQPQSKDASPKHSKIPKRQNSVSPSRSTKTTSRKQIENGLTQNQRFISNSTSSIHETIKIGSQVHDKRGMSKSTQNLDITPPHISGKPPISPGRGGPPPSNRLINAKRLSPIIGTPSKSPLEDPKPASVKTANKLSPVPKKPIKTASSTLATSKLNSRQPSRASSREPSPEKRKGITSKTILTKTDQKTKQVKPVNKTQSTRIAQKPAITNKPEPKKTISRTNSMNSLTRTPSTKNLTTKPPLIKRDSKKDLREKAQSTGKINEVGSKKEDSKKGSKLNDKKEIIKTEAEKNKKEDLKEKKEDIKTKTENSKLKEKTTVNAEKDDTDTVTGLDEIMKQDNETQYDTITNEKGELVIMTKKNVISMTTAAITAQPLEVVTTVTNQLPAAFEKAREKGIFERHNSKDSLGPKEDEKVDELDVIESKDEHDEHKPLKTVKNHTSTTIFTEDNFKMKPLQPPYNNPQVERVKQKIDDILKSPEVSTEKILSPFVETKPIKNAFKNLADKTKNDIKKNRNEIANKFTELKDLSLKQTDKITTDIRSEATRIVDSIITPVEEPKDIHEKAKDEVKRIIEPIITVVNEKKSNGLTNIDITEKVNETLVKGDGDVEVQSSILSTPANSIKITVKSDPVDGDRSDKSSQSNGGFPQSTSTTPKPPPRANRNQSLKDEKTIVLKDESDPTSDSEATQKKPNICQRLIGKCKTKCCTCCVKPKHEDSEKHMDETKDAKTREEEKKGLMNKLNCCKKNSAVLESSQDAETTVEKKSKIEFENETKPKRKLRDALCGLCGRQRRVSDVSSLASRHLSDVATPPNDALATPGDGVVRETGCCGKKRTKNERRDSILSDRPPNANICCNNRLGNWVRGKLHRPSEHSSSRRTSMFSKNKSLSPTLPPEDTRTKLDSSLVEHTSVIRGAIPVLPAALAYFCLACNVLVPGLGTILSGMFCLCFGIPRFGVHDGARQRIGSLLINLVVGCGQLFTVLFCLVGWGWSIWWGVIMVRTSRRYRKLRAEAAAAEEEATPPVTDNNHTAA